MTISPGLHYTLRVRCSRSIAISISSLRTGIIALRLETSSEILYYENMLWIRNNPEAKFLTISCSINSPTLANTFRSKFHSFLYVVFKNFSVLQTIHKWATHEKLTLYRFQRKTAGSRTFKNDPKHKRVEISKYYECNLKKISVHSEKSSPKSWTWQKKRRTKTHTR